LRRAWIPGSQPPGERLFGRLSSQVQKRGIKVLTGAPARELLTNDQGAAVGVVAEKDGGRISVKARRAVVMTCGGFEFNEAMKNEYLPVMPFYGIGSPGNTGDGIRMAQEVGAALWHMNNPLAGLGGIVVPEFDPVVIPINLSGAYIRVDKAGKRFMPETRPSRHGFGVKEFVLYFDGVTGEFSRLPCYAVFDESVRTGGPLTSMRKFGWFGWHSGYEWSADNSKEIEKGWIVRGQSLADLASKLGMKPADLEATVSGYNENCKKKVDPDFGRAANSLVALEKPPFYAVKLFPIMYNTQGGPRRNSKCQVVKPNGQPIPRLYSAGELGSFWGWMYNGGGNNAECLCTGQIAARNLVAMKSLA
jgi:succinate dehydrogenase/fumarate reductase flavoprotein subunit